MLACAIGPFRTSRRAVKCVFTHVRHSLRGDQSPGGSQATALAPTLYATCAYRILPQYRRDALNRDMHRGGWPFTYKELFTGLERIRRIGTGVRQFSKTRF